MLENHWIIFLTQNKDSENVERSPKFNFRESSMDENRLTISAIVSRVCLFLILCRCPKGDKTFVFLRISINSKNPLCTFQQKRLCYSLFQIRMVTCSIKYYSKQLAFQKLNRVALRRRRVCSEKVKKKGIFKILLCVQDKSTSQFKIIFKYNVPKQRS